MDKNKDSLGLRLNKVVDSRRTGRRPRKFYRRSSMYPRMPADAGKRPLRATRANPVFCTDEKRIRTENRVLDKSKRGVGLLLSDITDKNKRRRAICHGGVSPVGRAISRLTAIAMR